MGDPLFANPSLAQVDEVYKIMGTKSRATICICFLMSLFGETFAPFGVIAPILQVCSSLTEPAVSLIFR